MKWLLEIPLKMPGDLKLNLKIKVTRKAQSGTEGWNFQPYTLISGFDSITKNGH